jgi:hypothetical protein
MPDAPLLPELGRSLRSLGAQHEPCAEASHAAIFVPLLDARARAADRSKEFMLASLKGSTLAGRIETLVAAAAVQGVEEPAAARAITAQSAELMEPLRRAFMELDGAAQSALHSDAAWDDWVARLRAVFVSADVACQSLTKLLNARVAKGASPRWYKRTPK